MSQGQFVTSLIIRYIPLVTILLKYSFPSLWYSCRKFNAAPMRFVLYSRVKFFGTHLVHSFQTNRCFWWLYSSIIFSAPFCSDTTMRPTSSSTKMLRLMTHRLTTGRIWFPSHVANFCDIGQHKLILHYSKCYNSGGCYFEKYLKHCCIFAIHLSR